MTADPTLTAAFARLDAFTQSCDLARSVPLREHYEAVGNAAAEIHAHAIVDLYALTEEVKRLRTELASERAAWTDLRADVLQGGWTDDTIEINDVLGKIDEYMPDACVEPGAKEPTNAR